jgi:hypothetical protein
MSTRTRGTVDKETFKKVKDLQNMGASRSEAKRFVGLSQATVSRMFANDTFEAYREYVRSINQSSEVKPGEAVNIKPRESLLSFPMPEIKEDETSRLTTAILRLAMAIEENNDKKRSFFS